MKSLKSAITTIALVAMAFSYGQAGAESITVKKYIGKRQALAQSQNDVRRMLFFEYDLNII